MSCKLKPGDLVWVKKHSKPWWPAKVVKKEDCPIKLTPGRAGWCVAYLEDSEKFDSVKHAKDIKPFGCPEMDELIDKGTSINTNTEQKLIQKMTFDKAVKKALCKLNLSPDTVTNTDINTVRRTIDFGVNISDIVCTNSPENYTNCRNNVNVSDKVFTDSPENYTDCKKNTEESKQTKDRRSHFSRRAKSRTAARSVSLSPAIKRTCEKVTFLTPQVTPRKRKRGNDVTNSDYISINSENLPGLGKMEDLSDRNSSSKILKSTEPKNKTKSPTKLVFPKKRANVNGTSAKEDCKQTPKTHKKRENRTRRRSVSKPKRTDASSKDNNSNTSYKTSGISDVDSDDDGDDDKDLPEFSQESEEKPVNRGDIVWVKYKSHPFWPGVVKSCYKKAKNQPRITIIFLGPSKWKQYVFPMNYNKSMIRPFNAAKMELEQDAVGTEVEEEVSEAIKQAEDYFLKKALREASTVSPMEYFFGSNEPFKESPDVIVADANESDISETTSIFSDNKDLAARDPFDSDDMNESKKEQVQDDLDAAVISDKLQKSINRRRAQNQRIVDFIKGEKVKNYLIKVMKGEVESDWVKQFYEQPQSKQERVYRRMMDRYGPVADEEQIDEIMEALQKIYEEHNPQVLTNNNYVVEVLCPEAVIFSLTKVRRLTKAKATEMFHKGPKYFKEESEILSREMLRSVNIDNVEESEEMDEG